ncbi:hypothetical protein DID88_009726 [Monilinia fructigena]|uniref:Uncharacterized protein n=1 Tax=Monilinia fructigena TaxID=38457 RepID=A0A395IJU8_9HELO|nr:hypothetical protein DID88_009726 [Monilinia fructigena]
MSKRSTYERGESSKPPERPKTPGAYESSMLASHDDAFVEGDSKDELGERTPTPIRNIPTIEPPSFTFPKDLLKARKIYDGFKPREGYEKHVDTFFQYKIADKEHLRYAQKRTLLRFRKSLRRYGVYVNTKTDVETAILEVLSRNQHHEWTHHQLREYQRDESQPFVSAKWANIPVGIGSKAFDQTRPDERSNDRPNDRPPPASPTAPEAPEAPTGYRGKAAAATVPESIFPFEAPEAPSVASNRPSRPGNLRDGLRGRTGPPPSSNGDSSDPDDSDHPTTATATAEATEHQDERNSTTETTIEAIPDIKDNDMYKGYDDAWDLKVSIFDEHCRRVSLPDRLRYKAFPTMLTGAALEHYQANITNLPDTYEGLCRMMVLNFEGPEHQRNMLVVFSNMIMDIRLLQHTIPITMRSPDTYHMRIMTACDGVPECYSAICNPRSTATELINQIKQTIDSYQKTFPRRTVPTETFLTDRRFYNNTINPTRKLYDKNNRYDRKPRQALTAPPGRSKDDCYFPGCKIKGCRYYKHTQEEKDRVKGEYRSKYSNLDDKSFKTRYDHFITDTGQGSDNDDSDEDDVGDRLIEQYLVPLDLDSLKIVVFADASFANNKDYSSQIGYVVGFDISAAITATVGAILNQETPLIICTDSKSLYDLLTKLGTTSEKRLMIDIMALRQSYERREIVEIIWIDGPTNPADAMMTKGKPCQALTDLIDTNKISINPMKWVERE